MVWRRQAPNDYQSQCRFRSMSPYGVTRPQWVTLFGCTSFKVHDDVIKWKHFPLYWLFVRGIHRSPVNSPHQGQWRGALMLSLICACHGCLNSREAGDLRCHRAHYDVTVMDRRRIAITPYLCLYCRQMHYFKDNKPHCQLCNWHIISRHFAEDIFKYTFINAHCIFTKFHWNLFARTHLIISQHLFI